MLSIVNYKPEFRHYFKKLNRQWIEEHFTLEAVDLRVLTNPEEAILNTGGEILFALSDDKIAGTVALMSAAPGVFELTKMAVDKEMRGNGIGKALCLAAIDKARQLGAREVILYSNTSLKNAISIYRNMGFKEVPLEAGVYNRADIKMQILF